MTHRKCPICGCEIFKVAMEDREINLSHTDVWRNREILERKFKGTEQVFKGKYICSRCGKEID